MFSLWKKYLKHYKIHVILGPMFKILEAIFELMVPLVMANIIDKGIRSSNLDYIYKQGIILIVLAVVGFLTTMVCQTLASFTAQGFSTRIRHDLYAHINTLSMQEIDEFKVSSLITRLNNDINNMQTSVAMLIRLVIRAPFIVIGATIMAFRISPLLSSIFFACGALIFTSIFVIMKLCIPRNKKVQADLDNETTITKENLSGSRVVRAFNNQEYEINRFNKATDDLTNDATRVGRINALLNPISTILVSISIILVLFFSGKMVNTGDMTQGEVTALANYLNQILVAIVVVANLVVIFAKASSSGARIVEVFNKKPSIISGKLDSINNSYTYAIEFNDVEFRYNKSSVNAINRSSFNIKKGETIGIISSTGAGKTTLVNLMSRLYDTTKGEVLFFGENIKNYNLDFLHKNIVTVLQKSVLFNMTIRENLCLGEEFSDEEIEEALKMAQAYDFVSKLPQGVDTIVLQAGKNFSGGERQRLCIARALIRNPKVLILDDSSSALDYKTDLSLRKAIKELKNLTTIIISQKVSSIEHCDRIMVLDNGTITNFDTHERLLKNSNIYKEIYFSQGGECNE